ncbi:MAG: prolyl oligopeptidase family serine peptidase [Balneolales bacterium]
MSNKVIKKQSGSVASSEGLPIRYDLYYPHPAPDILRPVLFVHGFKGFKDWGPFPDACAELASGDRAIIAFNHSLGGIGESLINFDHPELFRKQTLSQDQQDIQSLLNAIRDRSLTAPNIRLDPDNVGIIGHSRGGHTAVTAAAEQDAIVKLVTWAAVSNYKTFLSDEMIKDWERKGYTEILNARTGQTMCIDRLVYDDFNENAGKLLASERVKSLYIPCCFIHGREDETVPVKNVNELFSNCPSGEKKRVIIENAGHTFGAAHPFDSEDFPPRFQEVLDHTRNWLLD